MTSKQFGLLFYVLLLLGLSTSTAAAQTRKDCQMVHQGTFEYQLDEVKYTIEISENSHKETSSDGVVIESALMWLSDCVFELTVQSVTAPTDFSLKKGDKSVVTILKTKGNKVYASMNFRGSTFDQEFTKVK